MKDECLEDVNVTTTGLYIMGGKDMGFLAASPDGLVWQRDEKPGYEKQTAPYAIEIKCVFDNPVATEERTQSYSSIHEIANRCGSSFYASVDKNGELQLKKTHKHYYQVQGILHVKYF